MRKMKKILAWLTVLTVNVSMMPMPTVAAATDASTALNEETTTSDATKEATQAQETAEKAVESATKAAATTAAKKVTTETKKAESKSKSAASTQSLQDTIEEGIVKDRDQTKIDVSDYDASKAEVKKATNKVLKDNGLSKLTDVTYDTNSEEKVETVNVETDVTYLMAVDELEAINDAASDEDKASEATMEEVEKSYAELQSYYESQPEYFGIAVPYFTSKDAKEGPISALLSVADIPRAAIGVEGGVTIDQVQQLVDGFKQALPGLVQVHGDELLAARKQALSHIKDGMTTAEKLLVLNDWLGNYSNFDMADIMKNQKKDSSSEDTSKQAVEAKVQKAAADPFAELYKSTAFGTLTNRKSVCMSYTAAYNYLVQCAFPEVYKNSDGTWKTKDEVNGKLELKTDADGNAILDSEGNKQYITKVLKKDEDGNPVKDGQGNEIYEEGGTPDYMVDFVRIQWNSEVEMLGETSNFNNPHFFSAAKVDGKWYYVDSCYNDIYVECMQRNRVETDGNMTHSYFLVSDTTLRKQFDGNFDYIDTLYENVATDTTYEDSWVNNAQGPVSYDDTYYYYIKNTSSYSQSGGYKKGEEQIVRVPRKSGLTSSDGEEVLLNLSTGDTKSDNKEAAELVKKEFAVDNDVNSKKYAGITHSVGYYNSALYFNVNNKIFKYDLESDKITEVKEYNTVSAQQDEDNEFTGMSFTVTTDKDKTVHTVKNHPIAALAIKDDGKMYVSIATNYCYASDYKYEETNYNSEYMNYKMGNQTISRGGDNDNQEFMWSANFVDTLDMSKVSSTDESAHHFDKVTVNPTCDANGFTEERCTDADCGIVKADTKEDTDQKATGHHYIKANDLYYTKDDAGNRKSGTYYLCTKCLDAQSSLPDGETAEHTYGNATATWNDDNTEAEVTVSCTVCRDKELDALLDDQNKNTQELTKTANTKDIKVEKPDGFDCEKGGDVTYVATATIDGKEYKVSKTVTVKAGQHTYGEPTFKWSDDLKTCTATVKCMNCGKEEKPDCKITSKKVEPTCETAGKTTHTATVEVGGKEYSETKDTDEIAALGHAYGEPTFKWSDDHKTCTATFTCKNDAKHVKDVDCTITPETTKAVTCEEDGEIVYTASCEFESKTYTNSDTYKEVVKATGHKYGKPSYSWSKDDKGNMICAATFTCEKCKKEEIVPVKENATTDNGTIIAEKVEPTCTEDGTYTYKAVVKFQGEAYTETKVETVKKTGHKYDNNGICTVCGHKRPTITLTSKKEVYTGKSISIDAPKVVGDVKDLKYSYYSDNACKNEISEPTDPGVYYVKVTADVGVTSNIATLTIVPQTAKVTTVANATSYMTVSWNKVNKASGYYVYRSTNGKKFTKIATVKSANAAKYSDKKATKNGQKYVYKVVTYYNGNQTVSSADSSVKTGYRLSTMKVSSLTNKKGKKAYIKWTKNSKSTGYQIKYVTGKSKAKTVKASSKAKTKTISKLKKGKTYKVRIRSYKKVSNVTYYSAWSKQKSVKIKK